MNSSSSSALCLPVSTAPVSCAGVCVSNIHHSSYTIYTSRNLSSRQRTRVV
ncbi:hypothetical protein PR001_g33375 [Phytophthora rubi]|uniref:Uncharacterized protein n=1 Tax=Phytophthora rubi TaxID=129364 RepID=A0A6A3G1A8_9STRA|nr:hypothetical protein PR001_g33375 [Phytophthora rubi]